MDTIEQACLLGQTQDIDKLLGQANLADKEEDFLSALCCCIEYQNLAIFRHLIDKTEFRASIQNQQIKLKTLMVKHDLPQFIKILDDTLAQCSNPYSFFAQQIELPLQELEPVLPPLASSVQICMADLFQYYQSTLAKHSLDHHLQLLRDAIAQAYHAAPACYEDHILPLNWESFLFIPELCAKEEAMSAYYGHSIHTAWRFLLNNNPWRHQASGFHYKELSKKNLWFIVLIWYVSMDSSFYLDSETKPLDRFIESLAKIHRSGNTDNRSGDQTLRNKDIRKILLKAMAHHPLAQPLEHQQVLAFEQQFIKQIWQARFEALSIEQYLQTKYHFEKQGDETSVILEKFNLDTQDFNNLSHRLTEKWGQRWYGNPNLIEESRARLLDAPYLCWQEAPLFHSLLKQHAPQRSNKYRLEFFGTDIESTDKQTTSPCISI